MVAVVWQFETLAGRQDEFERFYGADGEWTKLSRKSRSFLGSSFLKDIAHPAQYLLVEYWSEMVVYERHRVDFEREVQTLEARRAEFLARSEPVGIYSALDTPDRVGPAWSRRSG